MDFDKMTIGDFKELAKMFQGSVAKPDDSHWEIGKPYLIRTVTMIDLGIVVKVTPIEIVLKDAAWIADTGRFSEALVDPSRLNEVEPFPNGEVIINRSAIIDAVKFPRTERSKK